MDIQNFLAITIIGAILSFIIELVNRKFSASAWQSKAITVTLALIVGAVFIWVQSTSFYPTFITILGSASIVYGFILKKPTV